MVKNQTRVYGEINMKNRVISFLNSLKIRNKLIITYLIVAVTTVSIVCIYLTKKMNTVVVNDAIVKAAKNVDIMEQRTQEILKVSTRVSDMIYSDYTLHDMLKHNYNNPLEVFNAYNDYDILTKYLKYYTEISNITIYSENDTLMSSINISKVNDEIRDKKWYKNAIDGNGKIRWYYGYNINRNKTYLSLVRLIKNYKGEKVGVLVIDINNINLRDIVNTDTSECIIALNGINISGEENMDISEDLSNTDYYSLLEKSYGSNKYVTKTYLNENQYYIVVNSFKSDKALTDNFQAVVIIPTSKIVGETNKVIFNSFCVAVGAIIFSLIIIIYFSKSISGRIYLLSMEMKRVVNGDLYVSDKICGNDEIGQLNIDLKKMVESIRNLINQVYVQKINEEKLRASQMEMEFKMLSNQINPHFLYNTLETIRMKALMKGDKEISDIVKKLGKIMRRNLEVSGKPVTLQSEIILIRNYLEIQSMRFEGMVKFEIIIGENINADDYMILPLLLQPVVENAFVHGLEEKKNKGTILVNIFKENDFLKIIVEDNGIGIEEKKLIMINKNLNKKDNDNKSIGMRNVNQRIKIHYGDKYGIEIQSNIKIGTRVIITLPIWGEQKC